jgi:hypothetical protein
LTLLELGDVDAARVSGGANERGVDELQDGALAKGIRGSPWCVLTEQRYSRHHQH